MIFYIICSIIISIGIAHGLYRTFVIYRQGNFQTRTKIWLGLTAILFGIGLFWICGWLSGFILSYFH